ncbi:hypothetical protein IWQ57_004346 [Coemansia nantahalensis]|uniref:Uncharacterized protein n=1 Tax=Coemansia nantahalensis TaxID=2789366 RepID=A0ACC1JSK7_9FUNG|nr:hypothetical protein IWQ57_004346 [Coemansia nantahalensis]
MRRAVVLALDFDGTLTASDTLPAVVAAAAARRPSKLSHYPWCARKYAAVYADFAAKWQQEFDRTATASPVYPRLLDEYLESLRPIEEGSLHCITKHRVLACAYRSDFAAAGRNAVLRPGAAYAVNGFLRDPNFHVCVISANWSSDFIRGALEAARVGYRGRLPQIFSNDPEFSAYRRSTGAIQRNVVVVSDKAAALAKITDKVARKSGTQPAVVYAGDSLMDLPLLLRADLGLLVGHNEEVDAWCRRLGVQIGQPRYRGKVLHRLDSWREARNMVDAWAGSVAPAPAGDAPPAVAGSHAHQSSRKPADAKHAAGNSRPAKRKHPQKRRPPGRRHA